jgi:hypothetical protein
MSSLAFVRVTMDFAIPGSTAADGALWQSGVVIRLVSDSDNEWITSQLVWRRDDRSALTVVIVEHCSMTVLVAFVSITPQLVVCMCWDSYTGIANDHFEHSITQNLERNKITER